MWCCNSSLAQLLGGLSCDEQSWHKMHPKNSTACHLAQAMIKIFLYAVGVSSLRVPGLLWHPQILADLLTLSQPGEAECANQITNPGFSDLPTALNTLVKLVYVRSHFLLGSSFLFNIECVSILLVHWFLILKRKNWYHETQMSKPLEATIDHNWFQLLIFSFYP